MSSKMKSAVVIALYYLAQFVTVASGLLVGLDIGLHLWGRK